MPSLKYREITRRRIGKNRFVVISERSDGRFAIAQQVEAETDTGKVRLYIDNSIVVDLAGLEDIAFAVTKALEKLQPQLPNEFDG